MIHDVVNYFVTKKADHLCDLTGLFLINIAENLTSEGSFDRNVFKIGHESTFKIKQPIAKKIKEDK